MRIDIIADTVCPWCYVGKRRLERALALRPVEGVLLSWQPFQLNPDMPENGMDRGAYLKAKFGSFDRAARQYERLKEAGRDENIAFRFERISTTPNTVDSHRLIRFSEQTGKHAAVVEALYAAYFTEGRDIGDIDTLITVGAEHGLDTARLTEYLHSDRDRNVVREEDESLRQIGVSGVPCFVIEGKYAVSGAQAPEIFHQLFDLVRQEALEETPG